LCRFWPTPLRSCTRGTPTLASSCLGPTPDSSSSWGELMAPAARITSLLHLAVCVLPFLMNSTPSAVFVVGLIRIFVTVAFSITWRLGLSRAGRRKARALLSLDPFLKEVPSSYSTHLFSFVSLHSAFPNFRGFYMRKLPTNFD
jgi:hypothetical protein